MEIDNFKIKIVTFIINFGRNKSLEIDKYKSKNLALVSELLAILYTCFCAYYKRPRETFVLRTQNMSLIGKTVI